MSAADHTDLVHDAIADALAKVRMDGGALVEFAIVAWPAGQRVVAVNVTASPGVTPDRLRDALEWGAAQIRVA